MSKTDKQHVERLAAAYRAQHKRLHKEMPLDPAMLDAIYYAEAVAQFRIARAGAYAALPGRQNRKHVAGMLDTLVKAACRTIRRAK